MSNLDKFLLFHLATHDYPTTNFLFSSISQSFQVISFRIFFNFYIPGYIVPAYCTCSRGLNFNIFQGRKVWGCKGQGRSVITSIIIFSIVNTSLASFLFIHLSSWPFFLVSFSPYLFPFPLYPAVSRDFSSTVFHQIIFTGSQIHDSNSPQSLYSC
jgi:hypothetical protein